MTYRIVVVAGENQALRALTEQLGDNVQVKMIESANEALWEVRSDPPEVIIADLDLSEMSGLEMAEILPNFDVPTKIVIWSRSENPTAEKEAKEFGVSAFFVRLNFGQRHPGCNQSSCSRIWYNCQTT